MKEKRDCDKAAEASFPAGCGLISLPSASDPRGTLSFATGGRELPFAVERVFWIYGVPPGQSRGGHAHRTCSEAVFAVAGAVTARVDDGRRSASVRLCNPAQGLLVGAGAWCDLTDFEPGTVLAVAASEPYDAGGYIHSYEAFKREAGL